MSPVRFTRDDRKFHRMGVFVTLCRDFMSLISRARGEGARGGPCLRDL